MMNVISDALVAKDLVQVTASHVLMALRMKKAPAQNVIPDALVAKDLVPVTASPVLMAIRMKKALAQKRIRKCLPLILKIPKLVTHLKNMRTSEVIWLECRKQPPGQNLPRDH
ncbi:hypothetical protein cypCar_00007238 [Cyprinus carpio]|nr:hypothetical protein cypCar_00007238 [Cyprinus carpio]